MLAVNHPFKTFIREEWDIWMTNGKHTFTHWCGVIPDPAMDDSSSDNDSDSEAPETDTDVNDDQLAEAMDIFAERATDPKCIVSTF